MNRAWLDFVNSEWYDGYGGLEDRLDKPGWLAAYLKRWGFPDAGAPDARARPSLLRLRSLLRRMVERAAAGQPPSPAAVAALNAAFARAPLQRRLVGAGGDYHVVLEPQRRSWESIVAEIAASAAESLTRDDPRRVKVCANPGCRWAFYDSTKGRTRRWCRSGACGNRDKVRRFRQRRGGGRPSADFGVTNVPRPSGRRPRR